MAEIEVTGWVRTGLLALGALGGVLLTAGLIHVAKEYGLVR